MSLNREWEIVALGPVLAVLAANHLVETALSPVKAAQHPDLIVLNNCRLV